MYNILTCFNPQISIYSYRQDKCNFNVTSVTENPLRGSVLQDGRHFANTRRKTKKRDFRFSDSDGLLEHSKRPFLEFIKSACGRWQYWRHLTRHLRLANLKASAEETQSDIQNIFKGLSLPDYLALIEIFIYIMLPVSFQTTSALYLHNTVQAIEGRAFSN